MATILQIAIPVIVSFIAVNWVYFKVLRIAKEKQIFDNPNARKLQKTPVPILGGIAVFFGVLSGILASVASNEVLGIPATTTLLPMFCAMSLMIYTGAMDDMMGLSPGSRFLLEIFTVLCVVFASGRCVDSFHGLWGIETFNWWIAVPLTVVAGVGIINAINMIDGVNGLSSGLCILCNVVFGLAFYHSGDITNALLAFVVASALLPFFLHNVFGNKSRMFIGDAGTMVMGALMTWFVISLLSKDSMMEPERNGKTLNMVALALAILSVPVFDTVRVMMQRILQGKSPFHPDKTHLHHVFVRMGVSHLITAFTEILIDFLLIVAWVVMVECNVTMEWQLYLLIIFAIVLVWGLYFFMHWHEEHHTDFMHFLAQMGTKTHHNDKSWWKRFESWLDKPESKEMKEEYEPENQTAAYVEYYHFDNIDPENLKEVDRKRIYDFMKGKAEVYIDDIKKRSGADPLRVDALVYEGVLDGFIVTIKEGVWGMPMIVVLADEK